MKDGILVGIDAGTSVLMSVAFTADGKQVAVVAIPNQYVTHADGGVEQGMTRTWSDATATLRELAEKIPNLATRLIAISVTAQGDGMWLIDKDGEPVGPATIWLDNRAASIVEDYVATKNYADHDSSIQRPHNNINRRAGHVADGLNGTRKHVECAQACRLRGCEHNVSRPDMGAKLGRREWHLARHPRSSHQGPAMADGDGWLRRYSFRHPLTHAPRQHFG